MKITKITIVLLILLGSALNAKDDAQKLYDTEQYEDAVHKYERIIREHPDWEEAHFGRGAALYKSDQIDEAMQEFEKAISIKNPTQKAAVFYNMGNGFLKSNRLEESLKFYKRALELNPADFDAKHNFELVRQMMQQQQNQQNQQNQNQDQRQQQQQQPQQQQNQQNQPDQQKEEQQSQPQQQPQQQKAEREKSQEEAAQVLDALKDNEKKLMQERMKAKYSGIKKEKDW